MRVRLPWLSCLVLCSGPAAGLQEPRGAAAELRGAPQCCRGLHADPAAWAGGGGRQAGGPAGGSLCWEHGVNRGTLQPFESWDQAGTHVIFQSPADDAQLLALSTMQGTLFQLLMSGRQEVVLCTGGVPIQLAESQSVGY
jgi:hypothetical protein